MRTPYNLDDMVLNFGGLGRVVCMVNFRVRIYTLAYRILMIRKPCVFHINLFADLRVVLNISMHHVSCRLTV